ncbi:NEW3 domain-containing protein [Castellaniella sp.]|uniref:COG1470 family protein n=1 Tax=Castellaniella sp. TaxID=1955812 RepID=UPI002AFE62D9|nr:NEW3 domain-containing protein [Castellaniella sp.]
MMMPRILVLCASALCALSLQTAALAADAPPAGIYLSTDYPALTLKAGETSTVSLELHNQASPPERLALSLEGVPKGWTATLLGDGRPVASAMPGSDQTLMLKLRLDIPKGDAAQGAITIHADSGQRHLSLPLDITLAKQLPAQLSVQPDLPQLTGSARTAFDYQLTIKNDSGQDVLASLAASAPQYFDTSFTEGYGSQQISAVPIKAGESKNVKLHVRPPVTATSGEHDIQVKVAADGAQASTVLKLDITGQPALNLAGRDGLMSASAQIGSASNVPLELHNDGTAAAQDITLAGTTPSGWKIEFKPERVAQLDPGKTVEVQAQITPSAQSLAGDYMVKLHAKSAGQSADGDLRVSVTTSGLWGVSGAILIAVALLVLIGAVARYGRR